ncbi:MAG: hypothetical protein KIS87_13220, partial [Phycisphaeraceae bacterium]|nr:hypothetical protein [Phycisphaeraceae bacterium]
RRGSDEIVQVALRPQTWRTSVRGLPQTAVRSVADLDRLLRNYGLATGIVGIDPRDRAAGPRAQAVLLTPEVASALVFGHDLAAEQGQEGGADAR